MEVNRSSVYREQIRDLFDPTHGEFPENLNIMEIIDRTHLSKPAWGYRKMTDYMKNHYGCKVNKKRVRRLIDIIALYLGPNLSKRYHKQYVRPYLLRNLIYN